MASQSKSLKSQTFSTEADSSPTAKSYPNTPSTLPKQIPSSTLNPPQILTLSLSLSLSLMATASRLVFCELKSTEPATQVQVQKVMRGSDMSQVTDNVKIVLQPRLCTLRSYGSTDRVGVIKSRKDGGDDDNGGAVTSFFATLSDYIESSKKSQDFETISGRLAMMVFAATVTTEEVTGNSLFRKMDVERIAEASGVCLAAVTCAAIFAYFSSARTRVGKIFTLSCNTFIDSLIDQIVDGLFYEGEPSDWSDDM